MEKYSTLEKAMKALNNLSFHDGITELKFKSDRRIVLAWKKNEICLESVSTNTQPNFTKLPKNGMQVLKKTWRSIKDINTRKWNLFLVILDLKILNVKAETIYGDRSVCLEN